MKSKQFNVRLLIATVFFLLVSFSGYAGILKSKLNVLYVGGSADIYDMRNNRSKEDVAADVKNRMASFENMLKNYFEHVTVMHIDDYTPEQSANYDVTVMDAVPQKMDSNGKAVPALPQDFKEPVLFIGETSVSAAQHLGVKFDWYCLCLRGDALNIRTKHEIFSKPFPVKITTKNKPLPVEASCVNNREDKIYPSSIPMWSVQVGSYDDDELIKKGIQLRPGLIAHSGGFEDSPDAEYIAGGSSAKEANALALGRHGSFFHWGFAASPQYLTEEGKTVLANAIAYTSKFRGKKVIAKKLIPNIKTTYDIIGMKSSASERANELMNGYFAHLAKTFEDERVVLRKKKANGETLTAGQESFLNSKDDGIPKPNTIDTWLRMTQGELFKQFGTDLTAYKKYYEENMPYFYSDRNGKLSVDEDLKGLKIAKNDIKLLDAAIRLWESGDDVEKGKRILNRYTLATFETSEEWRKWFNENQKNLFFTESGGYYFMVNSDEDLKENDYSNKQKVTAYNNITTGETTDESPVSVSAGVVPLANGNKEIVIKFKIHPGYHIYSFVSQKDPFLPTEVTINTPEGYQNVGKLKSTTPTIYNPNRTTVFKDEALFIQEIAGQGTEEVVCTISYQSCNANICYPPEDKELKVKI